MRKLILSAALVAASVFGMTAVQAAEPVAGRPPSRGSKRSGRARDNAATTSAEIRPSANPINMWILAMAGKTSCQGATPDQTS